MALKTKEEAIADLVFTRSVAGMAYGLWAAHHDEISVLTSGEWNGTDSDFAKISDSVLDLCHHIYSLSEALIKTVLGPKITPTEFIMSDGIIYLLRAGGKDSFEEAELQLRSVQEDESKFVKALEEGANWVKFNSSGLFGSVESLLQTRFQEFIAKFREEYLRPVDPSVDSLFTPVDKAVPDFEALKQWFDNLVIMDANQLFKLYRETHSWCAEYIARYVSALKEATQFGSKD